MNPGKSPISGRQVTRKQAFKGLGDPKTWKKFSNEVYAEFRTKPKSKNKLLSRAFRKARKTLSREPITHIEPVFAQKTRRRTSAKRRPGVRGRKKT